MCSDTVLAASLITGKSRTAPRREDAKIFANASSAGATAGQVLIGGLVLSRIRESKSPNKAVSIAPCSTGRASTSVGPSSSARTESIIDPLFTITTSRWLLLLCLSHASTRKNTESLRKPMSIRRFSCGVVSKRWLVVTNVRSSEGASRRRIASAVDATSVSTKSRFI